MSLSASGLPFTCQIAPVIDRLAFTVFNSFHRASPPWASTASCSRSFIYLPRKFQGRAGTMHQSPTKGVAEHRFAALGRLTRHLVLDHVPVLDQNSVLDSHNVC